MFTNEADAVHTETTPTVPPVQIDQSNVAIVFTKTAPRHKNASVHRITF